MEAERFARRNYQEGVAMSKKGISEAEYHSQLRAVEKTKLRTKNGNLVRYPQGRGVLRCHVCKMRIKDHPVSYSCVYDGPLSERVG